MKRIALSLVAACACLGAALSSQTSGEPDAVAGGAFVREPIIVFTHDVLTSSGFESSSLIVYQDGFVTASRSRGAGSAAVVRSGIIGTVKAESWYHWLLQLGAAALPDGPTPDPTGNGASTLTVLKPRTRAWSHTFSFGPGDYPQVEAAIAAMFLRLNV